MTNSRDNKWEEIKRKSEELEREQTINVESASTSAPVSSSVAREQEQGGNAQGATDETQEKQLEHPSYEELEQKLTKAENSVNQYWNEILRVKAEAENFRRRAEKDISNAHKYGVEKMAFELLPVVDNLERCLESKAQNTDEVVKSVYIGIELTLKVFLEVLQKFEIKQVNPIGEIFNPALHTAMMMKNEPNAQSNVVLQVMQKGYMLKDRLLRPALVIVASNHI